MSGMVVGTPQYMSPEQSGGAAVDGRSDQYSLACTLYEMLVGQPPFTGPSVQAVMARHSLEPVPSLRIVRQSVPPSVEAAIMRAMAKLPVDRFPSIGAFLQALESPGATTAVAGTPVGPPAGVVWRVGRRSLIAVGVALLAVAAAWWFMAGSPAKPPAMARAPAPSRCSRPGAREQSGQLLSRGRDDGGAHRRPGPGRLAQGHRGFVGLRAFCTGRPLAPGRARARSRCRGAGVDTGGPGTACASNVRLLHVPDSTILFTGDYQSSLGELPDLQREITVAITSSIDAELARAERSRLGVRHPVDQRAYEAYLRGRFYLDRGEVEQARAQFEQSGRLAPDWAPSRVGLANYYTVLPFFTDVAPAEVLPKARAAIVRALELDSTLAEAHAANGYIRAYYEWDWRAAEREFRRAIELGPVTPTRTSPPVGFSRRAGGWTRPSCSSAGPSSWIRCRCRCWRTGPCWTISAAATTRPTGGCGKSFGATRPT